MRGFVLVHGACAACTRLIAYNPNHVPSIRVRGVKAAICASCHQRWNDMHRVSKGLGPLPIHPQAYEPEPEENL